MHRMRRILAISLASLPFLSNASASELRHVEDATLRSVFFIDHKDGWAVGDEGVILNTIDGGKSWDRQPVPCPRASLRSVQFLTKSVGWAVGREELPNGMGSVGVVLFTNNGGLAWKMQLPNTLPGLNQVRFVDTKTGFLIGDGSDRFPAGVFRTNDSGVHWEPIPGPRTTSWLAADFYDGKTGIFAGAWSRFVTLREDKFTIVQPANHADSLSGRDVTSMQILGRKTLAVAQGGLILTSVSGGAAWDYAKTKLPTEVLANLDFHALHAVKDKVWVVGRPGSVVLHSPDGGTSWSFQKTGQALPLHGVFFFDDKTGWAVGDAGTILASTDGGKSWTTQCQAGQRAAALCVHALNQDAPVDTVALLGADEGYLTTSLRITAPDPAIVAWGRPHDARRYAAAMRRAGALTGEALWHFPIPQHLEGCDKNTILAHWNKLHANLAEDELIRQLVLTLRIWRPSVVVSEHPESKTQLSALLGEAVQEAVRRAADAKAFPEQIDELGLQVWQVRKLYGLGGAAGATITQNNDEPRPRLRGTACDFASNALALLTDRYAILPKQRAHHRLQAVKETTVERHWMDGIEHKVGESRRDIKLEEADAKLQAILRQRRVAIALADSLDDPDRMMGMIPIALDQLPDEDAAAAAFAIAGKLVERGQWYGAQEVYLYLVDRCPAHPLTADAYRWLIRNNTSSEARRRNDLQHFAITKPIANPLSGRGAGSKNPLPMNPIQRVSHDELVANHADARMWNKGSREFIKRLGGFGAVHAFDPGTQFCLQSAQRQLGDHGNTLAWMKQFREFVPAGPWHEAVKSELWLTDRSQETPARVGRSRYTEVRPYLDGKFDDPCWQDWKPMVLENAVGATTAKYTTETMFAHDQEFLYIALKCTHPAGQRVAPVKPRPRDADVDAFDRVSILLDLDRDYSTYFHLEVDQRGCVRDSCGHDRSWNPKWYVAVRSEETSWHIEAAIPLSELTGEKLTNNSAWAFNVTRILPGRGVQSWSQPADVRPRPEGMSLLLFQTVTARPMLGGQ